MTERKKPPKTLEMGFDEALARFIKPIPKRLPMPSNEPSKGQTISGAGPKSGERVLGLGRSEGKSRVLDFLYHDARRIGAFLAQFHDLGLIQEIKQTESAGESESERAADTFAVKAMRGD